MLTKTMRGKHIDMGALVSANPNAIGIGSKGRMNARGDILGTDGKIARKREEQAQDYYKANPKAVKQVSLRDIGADVLPSPAEAVATLREKAKPEKDTKRPTRKIEDSED